MLSKNKIMISFRQNGENGGPYVSHKRICESNLKEKYQFIPLIIPKGRLGVFNLKVILKLVKDIRRINPEIVHFTGLQLEGFHVAIACKLAKVKTILAIHGSSNEALEFSKFKKKILNMLEIITLKNVVMAYGVSEYVSSWKNIKKYCKKYYGEIYNLPPKEYEIEESEKKIRKELGITNDEIVIVSTGRITKEKGYAILCESIKKIKVEQKITFVIVGNGDFKEEMQKELTKSKLKFKVLFLGYRNDIDKILNESDIFVIATLHETLCNSIIEAGRYGLPIVATNVGGIPEIIEHNLNGYLVEVFSEDQIVDALEKLIIDVNKRKEFSVLIKEKIRNKFDEKEITLKIDKMYKSVLKMEKNNEI